MGKILQGKKKDTNEFLLRSKRQGTSQEDMENGRISWQTLEMSSGRHK